MTVHGGESLRIETPFVDPYILDISPDQSELLVSGEGHETGRDLWVVPVPAGAPHRVGDVIAWGACFSPDGMHLLYSLGPDLYTRSKTEPRSAESLRWLDSHRRPRYSPTGDRLRFTVYDGDGLPLWEMRADGKNPHRLLPRVGDSLQQRCGIWSADAQFYFFLANFRARPLSNPVVGGDLWVTRGDRGTDKSDGAGRLSAGP